jgi:MOSC domain-containing protein YiiM
MSATPATATIVSVAQRGGHHFSKTPRLWVRVIAGLGVEGDGHAGTTVRHRSRVARDPTQPNLRQVHLLSAELLTELAASSFTIGPGDIGENLLTSGIDLLALPIDTILHIGADATLRVTGLRNPCSQLDRFRPGLMHAVLGRAPDGSLIRKAGIMAVVLTTGDIRPGDPILAEPPSPPHRPLLPV